MGRTGMLLTPTLPEIVRAASELDPPLPEIEARLFFFHYESNGWKVGKVPMVSYAGALGGWHCRWVQRGGPAAVNGSSSGRAKLTEVEKMYKAREYERIIKRMAVILNSYDGHADLRPVDRAEMIKLKEARNRLRQELGITI